MVQKLCACKCDCRQKLLTITSQKRNLCSGCFLGHCRGQGLLKKYTGGKFETTGKGFTDSVTQFEDMKSAYPTSLAELSAGDEAEVAAFNFTSGSYEVPVKDENEEKDSS